MLILITKSFINQTRNRYNIKLLEFRFEFLDQRSDKSSIVQATLIKFTILQVFIRLNLMILFSYGYQIKYVITLQVLAKKHLIAILHYILHKNFVNFLSMQKIKIKH